MLVVYKLPHIVQRPLFEWGADAVLDEILNFGLYAVLWANLPIFVLVKTRELPEMKNY
jgi:hypothetical protein